MLEVVRGGRGRFGGTSPAANTGEDAMLFAAFDWNQVLIAGAVGAN
jgi:hypothetical protein